MLSIPKKDSVEWIDLGPLDPRFAGVEVGVRHVGPKQARAWGYQLLSDQLEEAKRLVKMREGFTAESLPQLFGEQTMTMEGIKQSDETVGRILSESVAGLRSSNGTGTGVKDNDPEDALRALEYLSLADRLRLSQEIIARQNLTREQFHVAADSSDVERAGTADDHRRVSE